MRATGLKQLMRSKQIGFRTTLETVSYSQVESILCPAPNIDRNVSISNHLVLFYACTYVVQIVYVLCNFIVRKGKNIGHFFLKDIWPIIRNLYCRVCLEMLSTQPFPLELMFLEDNSKSGPMTQVHKHGLRSMASTPSGRLSLPLENWKYFLFVGLLGFFFHS